MKAKALLLMLLAVSPVLAINYKDFAGFCGSWLSVVDSNNEYNLYVADDVNGMGIVDFKDLVFFNKGIIKCPLCEQLKSSQMQIEVAAASGTNPKCCMECVGDLPDIIYVRVTDTVLRRCFVGEVERYMDGDYWGNLDLVYPAGEEDGMTVEITFCFITDGELIIGAYFGHCRCFEAIRHKLHCFLPPAPNHLVIDNRFLGGDKCYYEISLTPIP